MEYELHLLLVVTWISYLNISLCICEMDFRVGDAWVIVRNSESITVVFIICCSRTNVRALKKIFFIGV